MTSHPLSLPDLPTGPLVNRSTMFAAPPRLVGSGPRHDIACLGRDDRPGHPRAREPHAPTSHACPLATPPYPMPPANYPVSGSPLSLNYPPPATRNIFLPQPLSLPLPLHSPLHLCTRLRRSCTFARPLVYARSKHPGLRFPLERGICSLAHRSTCQPAS